MSGKIMVGSHGGVYVIRFEGDVRLAVSGSFDRYLDAMFADPDFVSVLIDLTAAVAIDSTSLGELAKLSLALQKRQQPVPLLICDAPDILRILNNMGFEDVFVIVSDRKDVRQQLAELPMANDIAEDEMRQRVIDAHETLMGLNEQNELAFRKLVDALQAESGVRNTRRTGS